MDLDGPVRRIVTGHDKDGKAVVLFEGEVPKNVAPDASSWMLWTSHHAPAQMAIEDRGAVKEFHPHGGGNNFRIVEFPPTPPDIREKLEPQFLINLFGLHKFAKLGKPVRHPLMHRTSSMDYAIVLAGECDMWLDETVHRVKAGDIIIQQATNHAWVNPTDKPVRIAFILNGGIDPLAKKKSAKKKAAPKPAKKKKKPAKKAKAKKAAKKKAQAKRRK